MAVKREGRSDERVAGGFSRLRAKSEGVEEVEGEGRGEEKTEQAG
jgi:hypothetical protein